MQLIRMNAPTGISPPAAFGLWVGALLWMWLVVPACGGSASSESDASAKSESSTKGGPEGEGGGKAGSAASSSEASTESKTTQDAAEDDEPTFGQQMRALGNVVKDRTQSCRTMALDKMPYALAEKAVPQVKPEAFEEACRWLVKRYDTGNEELLGRHFTADGVFIKLARFKDLYETVMADLQASKPGPRLSRALDELNRLSERLERSAGALSEFKIDSPPGDVFDKKKVPGGKIRAELENIGRNDRADLGTLLERFDELAATPAKAGDPAYRHSIDYQTRLRRRWIDNQRKLLESLHSDNPSYDQKVRAIAQAYFGQGEALIAAFEGATKPFVRAGEVPSAAETKALRKKLEEAQKTWEKTNAELGDRLSKVF